MSDGVRDADGGKRRLGVVLYNEFELLDAYGPLEMFGCLGEALEIVVIAEQTGPVKSSGGPKTLAEFDFSDAPELDLLLLPGGVGTIAELENPALMGFLHERCPLTDRRDRGQFHGVSVAPRCGRRSFQVTAESGERRSAALTFSCRRTADSVWL